MLYGGTGNDQYYITLGGGNDNIYEEGNGFDIINLNKTQNIGLWLADRDRDGSKDDLVLGLSSTQSIGIIDYMNGMEVEEILFSNGSIININQYLIDYSLI